MTSTPHPKRPCSAVRADGSPCRAWAVRGSVSPLCAAHGGTDAPIGAPLHNTNALKHGYYTPPATLRRIASAAPADHHLGPDPGAAPGLSPLPRGDVSTVVAPEPGEPWSIETVIIDLSIKQELLSHYIRSHLDELTVEQLGGMLRIHGQNASRLGRLLRDQKALTGDADDWMEQAINTALDELSEELGVQL